VVVDGVGDADVSDTLDGKVIVERGVRGKVGVDGVGGGGGGGRRGGCVMIFVAEMDGLKGCVCKANLLLTEFD